MEAHTTKHDLVSSACRLITDEELLLLELCSAATLSYLSLTLLNCKAFVAAVTRLATLAKDKYLMTQTVKFKIHPNDGPHKWGRMLFRLIPASDFKTLSAEMSILRILAENPQLAGHPSIPRFQIDCVINKIRGMFAG